MKLTARGQWLRFLRKGWMLMRITTLIILISALSVSAHTSGQTVTISSDNITMDQFFSQLTEQTGFSFLLKNGVLPPDQKVSAHFSGASLEQVLEQTLKPFSLTYRIEDKIVYILNSPQSTEHFLDSLPKVQGEIHGRVTNDKGEPLSNANITIKRTGDGTITGASGEFKLNNVKPSDQITISFIGYKKQIVKIGERNNFILILETTTDELDKVVVQAYGTTSQRLTTGNIGTVSAEQIAKQPVPNVLQVLQGQVAGVVVTSTSGYASGTIKVEIRGRNTIDPNFPSDPLYIIDGVPLTILNVNGGNTSYQQGSQGAIQSSLPSPANGQSPFFNINPSDIQSIEILKDADATAIYGSRGSNGVILITTKKGRAGKTHGDMSVYTGISQVPKYYDMLNTPQYVHVREQALHNDGLPVDINNAPDLTNWDTTRYTNWQKYLWGRNGQVLDVEGSISGGNERTTFRAGGGYHYQNEIMTVSGGNYQGSLSLNLNHKSANQKFSLAWSNIYSLTSINIVDLPGGAAILPPNAPAVFDSKGNPNYSGWNPISYYYNFGILEQPYTSKTNLLNSNLVLNYEILKGLMVRASLGYNNSQANQTRLIPIASQNPLYNPTGTSSFGFTNFHNLIVEPQLEYNTFLGIGKLDILFGGTVQNNITDGERIDGLNYKNDALLGSINNAPNKQVVDYQGEYKYSGIFGRINYNWKDKYIINLNARRDGSSRFGPGRQFGNFGSVGAAWIFSEEKAVKDNLKFLSFGKLRGSYGITGGDQIQDYQFLSLWQYGFGTYNGSVPLNPLGFSDSLLQWQVNKKLEFAINFGFLKDRINFEAAWYRNRCDNQLVSFPTPEFSGFTYVTSNSPANVENTGWEFTANAKIINNGHFTWTSRINIGINRNKLLSYPNFSQSPFTGSLAIGYPLNIRRLLHSTGVDPQTGEYIFEDRNKDGQITVDLTGKTSDDRAIYDMTPKFDGGFTSGFNYDNWSLSIFFYFKKQMGYSALSSISSFPGAFGNQPTSILGGWQKPGDISNVGRLTTFSTQNLYNYYQRSDAILTDASFIRLQNLYLSYELPVKLKDKVGMSSCKIYVQGENLFLISKYDGVDPEVQNFGGLPRARVITAGLSCTF